MQQDRTAGACALCTEVYGDAACRRCSFCVCGDLQRVRSVPSISIVVFLCNGEFYSVFLSTACLSCDVSGRLSITSFRNRCSYCINGKRCKYNLAHTDCCVVGGYFCANGRSSFVVCPPVALCRVQCAGLVCVYHGGRSLQHRPRRCYFLKTLSSSV